MKILKPTWVEHSGYSIFSVDIHPDGTRFATGGGDNKVKVWSIAPVAMEEAEQDSNVPKLLKSMESHYGPVNCVKWSRDGKYLASGSDDNLVMIWGLSVFGGGGLLSSSSFGSSEKTIENWICINTLRGHSADISEIAWSPDGKYLASSSFDKSIIIWDCSNNFKMVKQLEEHKGLVKGIAWDPIGRYLASQSEDRSVIVWRASDWVVESVISEPFQQACNSFFLRSSWSPDGQSLCAANGLNNQSQTAVLIQRTNWSLGCDFVGHKKQIVVARYSPIFYRDNKKNPYCCIALASLDNTITLWSSSSPRPLMVAKSVFDQSIQDISWLPDGYSFLCCSSDGTIGYIELSHAEIGGQPMPVSEKAALIKRAYGDAVRVGSDGQIIVSIHGVNNPIAAPAGGGAELSMLAENPDQLTMEDETTSTSKNTSNSNSNGSNSNNNNGQSAEMGVPIQIHPTQVVKQRQKETIINGRRRITPLNIGGPASSQAITKPSPLAIPSHLHHENKINGTPTIAPQSTETAESSNNLEPMDLSSNNEDLPSHSKSDTSSSIPLTPKSVHHHQPLSAMLKAAKLQNQPPHQPQQPQHTPKDSNKSAPSSTQTTPTGSNSSNNNNTNNSSNSNDLLSKRRSMEVQESVSKKKAKPGTSTASSSAQTKEKASASSLTAASESSGKQSNANAQAGGVFLHNDRQSSLQLPPATSSNHISKQLTYHDHSAAPGSSTSNDNFNLFLDITIVEQELLESTEYFSTIRYLKDTILWENKINGKVCIATGNRYWCAVATHDATLHIFNYNGVSVMSNIVLRNQLSFLESNKHHHLLIITCDGYLSVWDIRKKKSEISNRELPYFLNRDKLTIKHAFLTEEGKPIITMSNGVSYVFDCGVGEWIKVTDKLGSLSEFNSNDTNSIGILSKIQQAGNLGSMNDLLTLSNDRTSQLQLSTTFLEKQLFLSTILASPSEYRHWLLTYVTHLTNNANQLRLQEICNELLGPSNNNINGTGASSSNLDYDQLTANDKSLSVTTAWEPNILGLSKRDLLRELLPNIAKNRTLQRMVGQYKESLNQFTSNKDNPLDILFS